MGVRHWLMMVIGTALLLAACTSPGKPFAYRDLNVSLGPTSTPAQPATSQTSTISFTLRNTWNQPVTGVKWVLRDTTDDLNVVVVDEDDTVAIAAFDRVVIDVDLGVLSAGIRTYEVAVDPDDTHAEEDETNNTSTTLTVVTADQDIAFSGTPTVTLGSPASTSDFTIAFTLTSTLHAQATSPGGAITTPYEVTDSADGVVTPVSPASPLTVTVPGGTTGVPGSTTVTLTMPATGSAGTFVYTITLWPADDSDGDDGNLNNNTLTVTVVIPASG